MSEIKVHDNPEAFSRAVEGIDSYRLEAPLVADLGSGLRGFASAAFRGCDIRELYAQRAAFADGERFLPADISKDHLRPQWIGIYASTGSFTVDTWSTGFELLEGMGMVVPRSELQPNGLPYELTAQGTNGTSEIIRVIRPRAGVVDPEDSFKPLLRILPARVAVRNVVRNSGRRVSNPPGKTRQASKLAAEPQVRPMGRHTLHGFEPRRPGYGESWAPNS